MQFVVIARDYKDGLQRRIAVREKHVALGNEMKAAGNFLYAGAMLDNEGNMNGSVLVFDYPSRKELYEWLQKEPYMLNKVWENIEVIPFKVGPTFTK